MAEALLAVFSDVHSNLEALTAVLADMDECGVSRRVCLGDTVGYGPSPAQCLKLVRALDCPVLLGNHDAASAGEGDGQAMRDIARAGVEFSRRKLNGEQRGYLAALPFTFTSGGAEFVHASLEAPEDWVYVLRSDDAQAHFEIQRKPLCFCGHTHTPVVWHVDDTRDLRCYRPQGRVKIPRGGKTLVNVGSVGQPRDGSPLACYVIYNADEGWVEYRRVSYNVAKTQGKILRAKLPAALAERLSEGQ